MDGYIDESAGTMEPQRCERCKKMLKQHKWDVIEVYYYKIHYREKFLLCDQCVTHFMQYTDKKGTA